MEASVIDMIVAVVSQRIYVHISCIIILLE